MAERSKELITVGYYLSRFGYSTPPKTLNEISWKKAYSLFYKKLGQDREILQFEHSLKNTRDGFDSYFERTNREGWKDKEGNPAKLPIEAQEIFDELKELSEELVFEKV